MLKIRLQRVGRKNDPSFRIVATDSHTGPKSGNHVEILGFYNPRSGEVKVDGEGVKARMAHGAQVSGTVHNILVSEKIIEGKKINVLPKKSPIAKEGAEEASAAPAAEVPAETPAEEAAQAPTAEETPAEAPAEESPKEAPASEAAEEKQA